MRNAGVRITRVILVAPSRGLFGSKIDQKTHVRNQNQVPGPATSFLADETVGFCLNAHAGPIRKVNGNKSVGVTCATHITFALCVTHTMRPKGTTHAVE